MIRLLVDAFGFPLQSFLIGGERYHPSQTDSLLALSILTL